MVITKALIISTAESYTRAELVAMRKAALQKLQGDFVASASTGAGAGYTMAERAKAEELVELYTAAIDYLDNGGAGEPASQATAWSFWFHN